MLRAGLTVLTEELYLLTDAEMQLSNFRNGYFGLLSIIKDIILSPNTSKISDMN